MKKIYFAHCMADYDNQREAAAISLIRDALPDWWILNPNSVQVQSGFQGSPQRDSDPMAYFRKLVRDCDALAYLLNPGALSVGAGVGVEITEAFAWNKPVWAVSIPGRGPGSIWRTRTMPQRILSIEETRVLIRGAA